VVLATLLEDMASSTSIAGGSQNTGSGPQSFIGAGLCNSISGGYGIIGAGK
jgi:hypothetical protein